MLEMDPMLHVVILMMMMMLVVVVAQTGPEAPPVIPRKAVCPRDHHVAILLLLRDLQAVLPLATPLRDKV